MDLYVDETGTYYALGAGNAHLATTADGDLYVIMGPPPGPTDPTTVLTVYRSTDDGETWGSLGDWAPGGTFFDYGGRSKGETAYMAVAATALGALATTEVNADADSGAAWVMNERGEGVGLRYNLSISIPQASPHSDLIWLDGETVPTLIEDSPKSVSRQVTIGADLLPAWLATTTDADKAALEAIRTLQAIPGLVMLRLPTGEVMGGSVRGVTPSYAAGELVGVQVVFEEARAL